MFIYLEIVSVNSDKMSEAYKISKSIQKATAIVTDGDRTAWKSNAAEHGLGIPYIKRAFRTGHVITGINGIRGYRQVKRLERENPHAGKDSPAGLKIFYDKLIENGLGERNEMFALTREYIRTHRIGTTWEILSNFDGPKFLVSANGSTIARAAQEIFGFQNFVSNIDQFSGNRLTGVELLIKDGKDKAELASKMLSMNGIELRDCVAIGDSIGDEPMLRQAKFSIASPFATDYIKGVATYVLEDQSLLVPSANYIDVRLKHKDVRGEITEVWLGDVYRGALFSTNRGYARGGESNDDGKQLLMVSGKGFWLLIEDGEEKIVLQNRGDNLPIPAGIPHVFLALEDSVFLRLFDSGPYAKAIYHPLLRTYVEDINKVPRRFPAELMHKCRGFADLEHMRLRCDAY